MKTLSEIYDSINKKFKSKSKLDIEKGTTVDYYVLSSSDALLEAHKEIDSNKNPHIFTNLKGNDIDSMALLVDMPRLPEETDQTYLYRLMNWRSVAESSNIVAIENALIAMRYASNVAYVPLTQGVGTATAYIIPKTYDNDGPDKAIEETMERIKKVVSPGSIIDYVVPSIKAVNLTIYLASENGNMSDIQSNVKTKIETYVNGIAPGEYLELGEINKIGVNEPNVNYFAVSQMYVDSKVVTGLKILQKIETKFLFDDIIWLTVVI
jgi:hypothetical protein